MVVHCRRCNRVLKNPVAVKNGIGAVCARKTGFEMPARNESDTDQIVPYDGGNIWIQRLQPHRKTVSDLKTNVQRSIYRHSPTGFNFGYGGSGPADTALNIMRMFTNPDIADRHYQDFKSRFLGADVDRLEIPIEEIQKFFAEKNIEFQNPVIFAQGKLKLA